MPQQAKPKRHSAVSTASCSARQSFDQFRWVVALDPTDLKNKTTLTENRKHVMHNYLDGERMKPNSTDHRITRAKKRRPSRTEKASKIRDHHKIGSNATHRSSSVFSSSSSDSSCESSDLGSDAHKASTHATSMSGNIKAPMRVEPGDAMSILGLHNQGTPAPYQQHPTFDIFAPSPAVGSNVDSFGVLPSFSDINMDTEQLQWGYSGKFGGKELGANWTSTLLNAKHAFLSTMCISTSHDDVMRRGFQKPHERKPYGSWERQKARTEVIGLINEALNDPQIQTADATIVAVLHLLNSEIMGCDDTQMKIHQEGLHQMVRSRGGIDNLGNDGQLASILTSTMYMISALRETLPHPDFMKYASTRGTKPPNDNNSNIPESPIYCRQSGFLTTYHAIPSESPTASLLEDLRSLTTAFVQQTSHNIDRSAHIAHLHDKISHLPAAPTLPFPTESALHTYSALRLTAQVYAHSLHHRIPLSRSAAHLSLTTPSRAFGSPSTSWHILIKQALLATNLSDLWSHAAGTLFWIVLIAGACANPDSENNVRVRGASAEEEEARKWLAAIAVRCSIVLGLRHGGVVLEMLKRLVAVEQALAEGGEDEGEGACQSGQVIWPPSGHEELVTGTGSAEVAEPLFYGPMEMSIGQRGMHDFAMEFLDEF